MIMFMTKHMNQWQVVDIIIKYNNPSANRLTFVCIPCIDSWNFDKSNWIHHRKIFEWKYM